MKKIDLGRRVFGAAGVLFGAITLVGHSFNTWQQLGSVGNNWAREILVYLVAAIEIFGGLAIQWRKTAYVGAVALGGVYLAFALLWIPRIITEPTVYDPWGNFFEQFSQVAGALIIYSLFAEEGLPQTKEAARTGYISFGVCVISFTLEQVFYFSGTTAFVPKWIPLGQTFWAVATTIAFALAALALLSGRSALLASRLLTAMIVGFGLLIWIPALIADPHKIFNWAGNAENLSIAGAAWIVSDFLSQTARYSGGPAYAGLARAIGT